jgi:hypothetical protein
MGKKVLGSIVVAFGIICLLLSPGPDLKVWIIMGLLCLAGGGILITSGAKEDLDRTTSHRNYTGLRLSHIKPGPVKPARPQNNRWAKNNAKEIMTVFNKQKDISTASVPDSFMEKQ